MHIAKSIEGAGKRCRIIHGASAIDCAQRPGLRLVVVPTTPEKPEIEQRGEGECLVACHLGGGERGHVIGMGGIEVADGVEGLSARMEQTGVGRGSEAGRGFKGARVVFCGRLRGVEGAPGRRRRGPRSRRAPSALPGNGGTRDPRRRPPGFGRLALDHVRYTRVEGAPLASHQAGIDGLPGEGMAEGEVIGGDLDQELGRDQLLDGDDEGCFVEPA